LLDLPVAKTSCGRNVTGTVFRGDKRIALPTQQKQWCAQTHRCHRTRGGSDFQAQWENANAGCVSVATKGG